MIDFPNILRAQADAVRRQDGTALAQLYTQDGIYDDGFFGEHHSRPVIAKMLDRFYEGGSDFEWQFLDPLTDGKIGYAHYLFSYRSKVEGSVGQPVLFEGMSRFRFRDGLIESYTEIFDKGVALTQVGLSASHIAAILRKYAAAQNHKPDARAMLARRSGELK